MRVSKENHPFETQLLAALSLAKDLKYDEMENKIFKDVASYNAETQSQAEFETTKKKMKIRVQNWFFQGDLIEKTSGHL